MEKYGDKTVEQLKTLLRQRGASLKGKKKDLVQRLVDYDRNFDFRSHLFESSGEDEEELDLPASDTFKDVHAETPIPALTKKHISLYLNRFQKKSGPAVGMYQNGYLHFIRVSKQGNTFFFIGQVAAEMKKAIVYNAHAVVEEKGEVTGAQCECAAGHTKTACCKHVLVLLLGVEEMKRTGSMVTSKTCTQRLQSFHRPRKSYKGSPKRCSRMHLRRRTAANARLPCIPEEPQLQDDASYQAWFRNNVINGLGEGNKPIKQLIEPANIYAIENDHDYSKISMRDAILTKLQLKDVTEDVVVEVEERTRGQSENPLWHKYRSCRITASKFYRCCCAMTPESRKNIVKEILYPTHFTSRATEHGILNESVAVKKYMERFGGALEARECGLFVMQSHPFLAASPDRLLAEVTTLEVKCPVSAKDEMVKPENVSYLEEVHGRLELKRNHPYYYQIQGQLMVTKKEFCDFIVYTYQDLVHISIERDEQFISDMLGKLTKFYNEYFLPGLLEKFLYKHYDKLEL